MMIDDDDDDDDDEYTQPLSAVLKDTCRGTLLSIHLYSINVRGNMRECLDDDNDDDDDDNDDD